MQTMKFKASKPDANSLLYSKNIPPTVKSEIKKDDHNARVEILSFSFCSINIPEIKSETPYPIPVLKGAPTIPIFPIRT